MEAEVLFCTISKQTQQTHGTPIKYVPLDTHKKVNPGHQPDSSQHEINGIQNPCFCNVMDFRVKHDVDHRVRAKRECVVDCGVSLAWSYQTLVHRESGHFPLTSVNFLEGKC